MKDDRQEFEEILKSFVSAGRKRSLWLAEQNYKPYEELNKKCQSSKGKKQSKTKSVLAEFVKIALKL